MRKILTKFVNWRIVRTFGALQALTRVSYAMLVIVPLLAGVWPLYTLALLAGQEPIGKAGDKITNDLRLILKSLNPDPKFIDTPIADFSKETLTQQVNNLIGEITNVNDHLRRAIQTLPRDLPSVFWINFLTICRT